MVYSVINAQANFGSWEGVINWRAGFSDLVENCMNGATGCVEGAEWGVVEGLGRGCV